MIIVIFKDDQNQVTLNRLLKEVKGFKLGIPHWAYQRYKNIYDDQLI